MTHKNYSIKAGRFQNTRAEETTKIGFWQTLKLAKEMLFNTKARAPVGRLPEIKPDIEHFLKSDSHLKFIWFGHSTLLLNLDGKIILLDPNFSDSAAPAALCFFKNRFQSPVLYLDELPKIDMILISHDHYDHLDQQTISFFKNKNIQFITTLKVGDHLKRWGIDKRLITELDWHQAIRINGITFRATPARHYSGRTLFDRNKTLWASWVIESQKEKIFFSGDSSYDDHFKEIGKLYGPFDIAFMENGQYDLSWPDAHMFPEQSLQAVLDIKANIFVPIHWGMFDMSLHHWSEPAERIAKLARSQNIPIIMPYIGEIVNMRAPKQNNAWWEDTGYEKTYNRQTTSTAS